MIIDLAKSALRSTLAQAYWAAPHFLRHLQDHVLILMYHRVLPPSAVAAAFVQPGMYVTPATFQQHLRFLSTHFTMVSFEEALARWDANAWDAGERYCTVTFDDGWVDNYVHAFPVLRSFGVPATIFLPTALIGTSEWLWTDVLGHQLRMRGFAAAAIDAAVEQAKARDEAGRQQLFAELGVSLQAPERRQRCFLNWDEVREMSRAGIAFGSHTATHPALSRLAGEPLRRELRTPLEVLRQQRVNAVPVLSYPYGDHSPEVVAEARAAGYAAAVSTRPGRETTRPDDLFRLRRLDVHDDVTHSIPQLAFHLMRQTRAERAC